MRYFILLAVALFFLFPADYCHAADPAEYMNKGNRAYRAGSWELAVDFYAKAGVSNADLFYNRGNAHLKKGEIGQAILYYNRALRIKPRDEDILANLEYARFLRTDKIKPPDVSWQIRLITAPYRNLSVNEHALLSLALFTVLILLFSILASLPEGTSREKLKKLKNATAVVLICLSIQIFATGLKTWSESAVARGVVVEKRVSAFSAPSPDSEKIFELHDGVELRLDRMENGFVLAGLPSGWSGWIAFSSLEKI